MTRLGNKAFDYVRAILATKDPCSGSPVLFAIGRVYKAHIELSRYIDLMFQGPSSKAVEFTGGELKRAVSEAFSNIVSDAIGNGVPPLIDSALTEKETREILSLTKKIRSSYPDSFIEKKWDAQCQRWIELASRHVSHKSWVPNGIGRYLVIAAVVGAVIGGVYPWQSKIRDTKKSATTENHVVDDMVATETPAIRDEIARRVCTACNNVGRIDVLEMCPTCHGMGLVDRAQNQMRHRSRCRDCGGRGRVHWDHVCPFCRNNDECVIGIVHVQDPLAVLEKPHGLYYARGNRIAIELVQFFGEEK